MYRVILTATRTGKAVAELPVESFRFTETLNAPGSAEVVLALEPQHGAPTITPADIEPVNASVFVERDGVPMWGGIVWTYEASVEDMTLTLNAEGPLSYFRRRYLTTTKTYAQVSGPRIAADLLEWAQSQPGGWIGVDTSTAKDEGQPRDRTYYDYERVNIGEAVENIAAVRGGFDFRFAPRAWTATSWGWAFTTSYPPTGRETPRVFTLGGNAEVRGHTVDGTTVANNVDAVGAGEGESLPIENDRDPALALGRSAYPRLDDVLSLSDVREAPTLRDHARRRRGRGTKATAIPDLVVDPALLGSFALGDRVGVVGSLGLLRLDGRYRVTEVTVEVAPDAEAVSLAFAPVEVFDYA